MSSRLKQWRSLLLVGQQLVPPLSIAQMMDWKELWEMFKSWEIVLELTLLWKEPELPPADFGCSSTWRWHCVSISEPLSKTWRGCTLVWTCWRSEAASCVFFWENQISAGSCQAKACAPCRTATSCKLIICCNFRTREASQEEVEREWNEKLSLLYLFIFRLRINELWSSAGRFSAR